MTRRGPLNSRFAFPEIDTSQENPQKKSTDTLLTLRHENLPDELYHHLLDAIATHRVADRPDRYEPRLGKQRRNHYDWLTKPRAEMKRKMAKGVSKN
jgi:hypothetical protein